MPGAGVDYDDTEGETAQAVNSYRACSNFL